jgi:5-hydroxyisourate hydrolase-like protein (transthyretin family)
LVLEESPVFDDVYNILNSTKIDGKNAAITTFVVDNSMQGAIIKNVSLSFIGNVVKSVTTNARSSMLLYIEIRIHLDSINAVYHVGLITGNTLP